MQHFRIFCSSFLVLAFLATSSFAQAPAGDAFGKSMDEFLKTDDNVAKVANALERYFRKKQDEDRKKAAQAEQDEVESQFKNPVKIDNGTSPVRGNASAKVTIVEFSDFQCPFCGRGTAVMDQIREAYPNDVKIVFKNLPLPFHENAKPAALAALAAGNQGKFWEMHDLLFKNQNELSPAKYEEFAKQIGLNIDKFKADVASPATQKKIDDDMALASQLGVQGTPGFFVNGVAVKGARPFEDFKKIIDRWMSMK